MWFVVCLCCVILLLGLCVWPMFSLLCLFLLVGCPVLVNWFPSKNGRHAAVLVRSAVPYGSSSFGFGGFALCFFIWDGMLCLT